jgi:chlorite dismutase
MPYHNYIFFDIEPSIHALNSAELLSAKQAFVECVERCTNVQVRSYALLGMKTGMRFMLDLQAASPKDTQALLRNVVHTTLGRHLRVAYTLLGNTRSSEYNPTKPPVASVSEAPHIYLIIYPFTKTIAWHLLSYDERKNMMKAHIEVGRKFSSSISQLLLYSFGIDDHEFIVSYQTDELEDFQTLVMELRNTEARRYTEKDTPIFTCIHMPLQEALDMV